jgi:4-hydroxybutyrate CoA-transferase
MDWHAEYRRKLVSAEQAANAIKSHDRVVVPLTGEPALLFPALTKRASELQDVKIVVAVPRQEWDFLKPGLESSFSVAFDNFVGANGRSFLEQHRADYYPNLFSFHAKLLEERGADAPPIDVATFVVSPPDADGYCYFGTNVWHKKVVARSAKLRIAEVQPRVIRTRGGGRLHVSEIELFVEHDAPAAYRAVPPADDVALRVAEHINPILRSGDTLQIGTGRAVLSMPLDVLLKGKEDLGWHSEITHGPVVKRIKAGQINSSRKTINRGIAITTNVQNYDQEDLAFIEDNPSFEVRECTYTNYVPTIAGHENMAAINSAISVDLTGQIASETVGGNIFNGMGGQPEFVFGSLLSKGGRSIHVLPSTAAGGHISRIVPQLLTGDFVTIPRSWADYVVTEWGVAKLLGKSHRERAEALIAVAHPNFRDELRSAARKLFWP